MENLDYVALNNLINNLAEFLKKANTNTTSDISNLWVVFMTPIFTGGITFLVNWFIKLFDYKNDYYKKIIDKRINAYEELEKFIEELDIGRDNNYDNKTYHCYNFLTEINDCMAAAKKSANICGLNSWFSVNLESQVNYFNEKLVSVANEMNNKAREAQIDKNIDLQKEIYQIACKYHNEIKELIFNLKAEIIKDRLKLHEVEDYLKEKQKNLKM